MDSAYIYIYIYDERYSCVLHYDAWNIYGCRRSKNRWIRRQLGEKAWLLGGWKRLWSSNSFEDPMKSVKDEQIIRRRLIYIYILFLIFIYISRNEPGDNIPKGFPSFWDTPHVNSLLVGSPSVHGLQSVVDGPGQLQDIQDIFKKGGVFRTK